MTNRILIGTLAVLTAACGGGDAPGTGEASVRDSAGIQIVENSGPAHAEGEGWLLSAEPTFEVGGDETNPVYDLGQVTGATRLRDGSVAVANAATSEVRFYNPDGSHRITSGRSGAGPGEFQMIVGMWRTPADSLVVLDMAIQRLSVLSPAGQYSHSFSLGGMGGGMVPGADGSISMAIPAGMFDDGSLVGMANSFRIGDTREGSFRDPMPLVRYGPDGAIRDTVATVPGQEMEMMTLSFGEQSIAVPTPVSLGKQTIVAARADKLYLAVNDSWEIEARDPDGTIRRLIRLVAPVRPLTADLIARHRVEQLELVNNQPMVSQAPQQIRDQVTERVNSAPYPATLPFVALMLVDDEGYLWAQEVPVPGELRQKWGVFDLAGRLQAWVRMPERFRPTAIGSDWVVGIWQDENDVEHVRVYGLTRG
ncbi:MAG TPA: hypothetical protein VMK53_10180 [Gemmatimonadales bacterium]|nr:hypothetical protein [Gemmatimonadales bacterium]